MSLIESPLRASVKLMKGISTPAIETIPATRSADSTNRARTLLPAVSTLSAQVDPPSTENCRSTLKKSPWAGSQGAVAAPSKNDPQRRDHRARRPWQDHAGRQPPQAVGQLPRGRAREARGRAARPHHGLQPARARARHHDPLQELRRELPRAGRQGLPHQHHRHARATPTSAARSSACFAWPTGACLLVDPRRPDAPDQVRAGQGARAGPQAGRHRQQGRPPGRQRRGSRQDNEVFDSGRTRRRGSRAGLPGDLRRRARRLGASNWPCPAQKPRTCATSSRRS
jgi:hypothetical protein